MNDCTVVFMLLLCLTRCVIYCGNCD